MNDIDYDTLECAIHHVIEPHQEGSIWCPECWHTYWDADELIETERREWSALWRDKPINIDEIGACPLCLHDW